MTLFTKKYFKEGCPYCGAKVKTVSASVVGNRDPDRKAYVCSNFYIDPEGYPVEDTTNHAVKRKCATYVLGHTPSSTMDNAGVPLGRLADENLRKTHRELNKVFTTFWKDRIINDVWEYVVGYKTGSGEVLYARRISFKGEEATIKFINSGDTAIVKKSDIEPVDARTKAYVWLAVEMEKDFDFSLQDLDEKETIDAINIINKTIKKNENRDN